jgi:hypothetical protein
MDIKEYFDKIETLEDIKNDLSSIRRQIVSWATQTVRSFYSRCIEKYKDEIQYCFVRDSDWETFDGGSDSLTFDFVLNYRWDHVRIPTEKIFKNISDEEMKEYSSFYTLYKKEEENSLSLEKSSIWGTRIFFFLIASASFFGRESNILFAHFVERRTAIYLPLLAVANPCPPSVRQPSRAISPGFKLAL